MSNPHAEPTATRTAPVPPQGCPAHGLEGAPVRRVYGREAEGSPYELYERLRREHGAVAPVLLPGDVTAWLVLGHRENLEVMRTPSLFTADSRNWSAVREGRLSADSPLLPVTAWQPLLVFVDGEEHARLRGAITAALGRFNRHGVRRHIVRLTHQLIDGFIARGEADLVTEFADRLPILVMTRLCGIPEEYGIPLGDAVRDMVSGSDTAVRSNEYVMTTMREMVRIKRDAPDKDLISWLIDHEAGLSDDEVAEHVRHALTVSNVTTSNLVAGTLRMVLTDPRFRGNLSGGQMTLPDALDQVLWDQPPLAVIPTRWALGDTVLGGQEIHAGDMVMLGIAAGNVDPEIRPDLKTPMHGNRSHLAFGSGPHECPGIDIGRAVADTGIDALLGRMPEIELAVSDAELTMTTTWMSARLDSLPVRFPPARPRDTDQPPPDLSTAPAAQPLPAAEPAAPPVPRAAPAAAVPRTPWWRRLFGR
ncbi:cytochrome P450 [Streptomyces sp. NPDC059248]|uniref:cytochrome P450 n=1 Tax=Streptomyces sp. NPDC059248 TaxID=3346791 RepID=UPI0036B886C1